MPSTQVMLSYMLLMAPVLTVSDSTEAGPSYLLYTRRNPNAPHRIDPEVESLIRSPFYAVEPVVLSIPHWRGNNSQALVSALLEREACNVFSLDLTESENESEIVGSLSKFLITLNRYFAVPLRRQQLLGFAEGAHLAGAIAEEVHQQLGEQLPHITALDPTTGETLESKLSAQAAAFVDAVHTNSRGFGTPLQVGHVDYYPNGGEQQPGCQSTTDPDACSHERVLNLAIEMWSPENDFVSAKCSSVEHMSARDCRWSSLRMGDMSMSSSGAGVYFLETRSNSPFGRGAYYIGFL